MHPNIKTLVSLLLVNYELLTIAKSDFTSFGIPARYSLFSIRKIRVQHLSYRIYKGVYSCGEDYIGETIRNVKIRWNEHESGIDKNSECFKHLQEHLSNGFHRSVLSIAPRNTFKRRILEAYFIKIMVSSLNSQMNNNVLTLFRNGVT